VRAAERTSGSIRRALTPIMSTPGIHSDPVRDAPAPPAAVGLEGPVAPHVDVGGRLRGEHAHPLGRVVGPQGAVPPAYGAAAIVDLRRRGVDLQAYGAAMARSFYHPSPTAPLLNRGTKRIYDSALRSAPRTAIQRSAWKGISPNFACRGFCEVRLSVATVVSKIRRLRDDRCPLPGQDTNVASDGG
jgi:hypothetical protein